MQYVHINQPNAPYFDPKKAHRVPLHQTMPGTYVGDGVSIRSFAGPETYQWPPHPQMQPQRPPDVPGAHNEAYRQAFLAALARYFMQRPHPVPPDWRPF